MSFRPRCWLALLTFLWFGGSEVSSVSAAGETERPFSPAGLTVLLLETDPSAPGTVYLYVMTGLFKSTDGGRTWSWSSLRLETGMDNLGALVADPPRPGTLYALSSGPSINLFGSTDGGASWRRLGSPPLEETNSWGGALAIDRAGTVHAAIGGVLVSTSDRGGTWGPIHDFKAPIQSLAISPTAQGTLYVATSSVGGGVSIPARIHKSEDGGRTWREIGGDVLTPDLGLSLGLGTVFLGVATTLPETVYAGVTGRGIYRSTDGGVSWSRLALGKPNESMELKALHVDRVAPATLYVAFLSYSRASSQASSHVAVSHDGGTTWRSRDDGLSLPGPLRLLAVDSSTGALLVADGFGNLQISTEKQPWKNLLYRSFGGSFPQEGKVRFRPGDSSRVCTLLSGQLWKSADGGKTWTAPSTASGSPFLNDVAMDVADPDLLYGAAETGVFRSSDGGESWTRLHGGMTRSLLLPRPGLILAGGCGIARSADGGTTWKEVLPCEGVDPFNRREIERLRIHAAAPNDILATAVHVVQDAKTRSVYRSGDGGVTWSLVPGANLVTHDTLRPQTLYAAKGDHLEKSTDNGATWTTMGSFGRVGELTDLVVDPAKPETLYGFLSWGLVRSRDGGRTWGPPERFHSSVINISSFLPHPTVPHLFYIGGSNGISELRLKP